MIFFYLKKFFILIEAESGKTQWENRIEKGLFRGRDSNKARLTLAELSQENPDLLDAGMTNYNFREKNETKWGPIANFISLNDMAKYKVPFYKFLSFSSKLFSSNF